MLYMYNIFIYVHRTLVRRHSSLIIICRLSYRYGTRPWAKFLLSIETNTVKFINATIIIYISHKCIILKLTFRVGFGYEFKKLFLRSIYIYILASDSCT